MLRVVQKPDRVGDRQADDEQRDDDPGRQPAARDPRDAELARPARRDAMRAHAGAPLVPSARCMTCSSSISSPASSPTTPPSRQTSTRCARPGDLGQVAGGEHDRHPVGGERSHQPVDLGLGADVDAARRLVEQQHARSRAQPLGEHDLLLVAARELPCALVRARRRGSTARPRSCSNAARSRRGREPATRRDRGQVGQRRVRPHRERQHEPLGLALLGHEHEARARPRARTEEPTARPPTRHLAGGASVRRPPACAAAGCCPIRACRRPRRSRPRGPQGRGRRHRGRPPPPPREPAARLHRRARRARGRRCRRRGRPSRAPGARRRTRRSARSRPAGRRGAR